MIRAAMFLCLIFAVSICAQQPVGDFRPDNIDNVWEYYWQVEPYSRQDPFIDIGESLYVKITLEDYEFENMDTLYIFNIWEKGVVTTIDNGGPEVKTPVDNRYNISVYFKFNVIMVVDDIYYSIMLENGREPITMLNPLYRNHTIGLDSLEKIRFGTDSLYSYTVESRQYIQNIGLVFDSTRTFGNALEKLKLLSFNNKRFDSAVRYFISDRAGQLPYGHSARTLFRSSIVLDGNLKGEGMTFSPLGRVIRADRICRGSMVIRAGRR